MLKSFFLILVLLAPVLAQESHTKFGVGIETINDKKYLSLSFDNENSWHTYWKNPGHSGLPFKHEIYLETPGDLDSELFPLEWPTPHYFIEPGEILAFGYEGKYFFLYEIKNPEKMVGKVITVHSKWLICKDICLPGEGELPLKINKDLNSKTKDYTKLEDSNSYLHNLPAVAPEQVDQLLELTLVKANEADQLALHYQFPLKNREFLDHHQFLITPFPSEGLNFNIENLTLNPTENMLYARMSMDWEGEYLEPPRSFPTNFVLDQELKLKFLLWDLNTNNNYIIQRSFTEIKKSSDTSYQSLLKGFSQRGNIGKKGETPNGGVASILSILLFAFLGGLILNLMPCVLPVISLKLFSLIQHAKENKKQILRHNFFYSLGVISTFWIIGIVVISFKFAGQSIGWGFQLQSPIFVFIMVILLFLMSLNLLSLFEFGIPLGRKLGNISIKDTYWGDFFSGALATILSTPCSAPFLGSALAFAFSQPPIYILVIFTFVGLGLSFPFIITSIYPQSISWLPKPGVWMEKLKFYLGLTMLVSVVWLYDVLISLTNFSEVNHLINLILILIFFFFFQRKFITKNKVISTLTIAAIIATFSQIHFSPKSTTTKTSKTNHNSNWDSWSLEKLESLKEKKRWVFIDFTASWCLTCKVNKKLVLNTEEFSQYTSDKNVVLLTADWTDGDPLITEFLKSYHLVGVPAYFIQTPDGDLISLGETITMGKIKKYIP